MAFTLGLHGRRWAFEGVTRPWCQADVLHNDLSGGPQGRLLVLELSVGSADLDVVRDLNVLVLHSCWHRNHQKASCIARGEAKGAIHLTVGGEGGLQKPRHSDLPLWILLQCGTQSVQIEDGVHRVHGFSTVFVIHQHNLFGQTIWKPVCEAFWAWIFGFQQSGPHLRCVGHHGHHHKAKLHHVRKRVGVGTRRNPRDATT